jgi:hypothetical protein
MKIRTTKDRRERNQNIALNWNRATKTRKQQFVWYVGCLNIWHNSSNFLTLCHPFIIMVSFYLCVDVKLHRFNYTFLSQQFLSIMFVAEFCVDRNLTRIMHTKYVHQGAVDKFGSCFISSFMQLITFHFGHLIVVYIYRNNLVYYFHHRHHHVSMFDELILLHGYMEQSHRIFSLRKWHRVSRCFNSTFFSN